MSVYMFQLFCKQKDFYCEFIFVKYFSNRYFIVNIHGRQWVITYRNHSRKKKAYLNGIFR